MRKVNGLYKCMTLCLLFAVLILGSARFNVYAGEEDNKNYVSDGKMDNIPSDGRDAAGNDSLVSIRISIGENQSTPVFKAGEKSKLNLSVTNNGNSKAENLRISPYIDSEDQWPFELDQLNYEQKIGSIRPGETVSVTWGNEDGLRVKKDVTGKTYKLSFIIVFDDGRNEYEINKYLFVKTEAENNSEKENPDKQKPDSGTETVNLKNEGDKNQIQVNEPAGSYFTGEPVISSGGGDGSGAGNNASVPRVIVTGFTTDPAQVHAGTDFKLIVHLKNTSVKTAVSNMLFDFQSPASGTEAGAEAPAFLPSSGSSSVYVDRIDAGGTKDVSIDLNARADLVKKPYSINMNMKYEDMSGGQYEAMSGLAIPVIQEARFELSDIQIAPDTVAAGEEVNVSCSLYNLGRIKMYNVKARMDGDGIEAQDQFIGNIDSGSTGLIDCIVTTLPDVSGEKKCRLLLSYEDDSGTVKTSEMEYRLNILPAMEMQEPEYMPEETHENSMIPVILLAAVLVAASVFAAVVIRHRRKKNTKAAEEDWFDEMERSVHNEREQSKKKKT